MPGPDSSERGTLQPQDIEVASASLQTTLSAVAGYDGKSMFLAALHAAAITAFVGLRASADIHPALFWSGIALAGLAVLIGLFSLWSGPASHFPTPALVMGLARRQDLDGDLRPWIYLSMLRRSAREAALLMVRKGKAWRAMLLLTPLVVAILLAAVATGVSEATAPASPETGSSLLAPQIPPT